MSPKRRTLSLHLFCQVRESLQAFNAMSSEMQGDLQAMAENYRHCAEVNRRWESLLTNTQAPEGEEGASAAAAAATNTKGGLL